MSVVIVIVVVDMKITSGQSRHLIDLKVKLICRNQQKKTKKNWPQCASNLLVQATSVTNSAFIPMPIDHTYWVMCSLCTCA